MTPVLRRLITHEWRMLAADAVVRLATIGLAGMIVFGVANGASVWRSQDERARAIHARMEARLDQWRLTATDPYATSAQLWDLALPVSPLAWLSVGQSEVLAGTAEAYTWSTPDKLLAKADPQNPATLRIGRLDLAFVIAYLVPLFAIALGCDMLAGEKEAGTLALLLSQPVSLRSLLLGKLVARLAILIGVVTVSTAVGMALEGVIVGGVALWMRLALGWLLTAVYAVLWLSLAATLNLADRPAVTNTLALVAIWVLVVIVGPSVVASTTTLAYPVPARAELVIADRDADPDVARNGDAALERYYREHPEVRPLSTITERQTNRAQLLLVFLDGQRRVERLAHDIENAVRVRREAALGWSRLSPAVLMQESLDELAGTGASRYRAFHDQVKQFVQRQRSYFVPRVVQWKLLNGADQDGLPRFRFEEPALAVVIRGALVNVGRLIGFTLALGFVAFRLRRTYAIGT
jgi:ABC-2 type transport system permease protein